MRLQNYISENIEQLYDKEVVRRKKFFPEVFGGLSQEQHDEQRERFQDYLMKSAETLVRNRH